VPDNSTFPFYIGDDDPFGAHFESVCVAFMPFRSLGPACRDYRDQEWRRFPNLRSKIQAKLGLILRELGPWHSRDGHALAVIVHQKAHQTNLGTVLSH
jgi:hypothetical protein